ncbi:MAG: hypothetical protein K0U98_03170 [Deltaproteobacteria bacterium]|nr:hypothetical protein [Deltaproteobacteria bacterium]
MDVISKGKLGSGKSDSLTSSAGARKAYKAPELVEWGDILDLTQGTFNGTQDGFLSGTIGS